jgi:hypothetical protein
MIPKKSDHIVANWFFVDIGAWKIVEVALVTMASSEHVVHMWSV